MHRYLHPSFSKSGWLPCRIVILDVLIQATTNNDNSVRWWKVVAKMPAEVNRHMSSLLINHLSLRHRWQWWTNPSMVERSLGTGRYCQFRYWLCSTELSGYLHTTSILSRLDRTDHQQDRSNNSHANRNLRTITPHSIGSNRNNHTATSHSVGPNSNTYTVTANTFRTNDHVQTMFDNKIHCPCVEHNDCSKLDNDK